MAKRFVLPLLAGSMTASAFVTTRSLRRSQPLRGLLDDLLGSKAYGGACVMGEEEIMSPKEHGTSKVPVQADLRWDCANDVADRICNFNRHYAEYAGYWETTSFLKEHSMASVLENGEITFYDSNTGKPLFYAPRGRTFDEFVAESKSHGWPSFRDEETNWEYVRVLANGEAVSVDGTHLGHNLPDRSGNRYCINLVSVAGKPVE
mmetsp:Transcript_29371/g.65757  ORF Transcript_29371/g.65757 Transcript_29371/m.65757 type:complete len:205 (-) Transcript_29371:350-964(-)|eukprot:CAMPEP_0172582484 /NCGR_PEP_ID=MMETSP1068-20121228/1905_1 /TAXON_ID=35684 /ORGANISM="Pseudopedinella elastica, Strain CCMP716" /LENGTH=204 /DNA_ID=CAMNT_0013375855 /DNA_START=93 /DNA_END=707 /DNA_ORIENTATION=+